MKTTFFRELSHAHSQFTYSCQMESNIYWTCYRFWHIIFMILILQILATIYVDQFSFLCLIWLSSLNCVGYIWIYAHSDPIKLTHGFEVIIEIITVSLFLFFSFLHTKNWKLIPTSMFQVWIVRTNISFFMCAHKLFLRF